MAEEGTADIDSKIRNRTGLLVVHTTSVAEEIQKLALAAKVVKAFNTIFPRLLPTEAREGRATVQVFFEPVESGSLSNSCYLEPCARSTSGLASSSAGERVQLRPGSRLLDRPLP